MSTLTEERVNNNKGYAFKDLCLLSAHISLWLFYCLELWVTQVQRFDKRIISCYQAGVSVKFLMVEETNSMIGYHLITEDHSIPLEVWECCESLPQVQGSTLVGVWIFWKLFWI